MIISGLQKLTLLDYPGKVACTVFTHGCNFKCPFCHNASLVTQAAENTISEDEFFTFLQKRKGILEGVCITGGEPTLQKDLPEFMKKIKQMGYSVKLDTNGYNPEVLQSILTEDLADYIAMDIKNSAESYQLTAGKENLDTDKIRKSIELIKNSGKDYEFRTTVVYPYHTPESLLGCAEMIGKDRKYFLQQFKDSGELIDPECQGSNDTAVNGFTQELKKLGDNVTLRGV